MKHPKLVTAIVTVVAMFTLQCAVALLVMAAGWYDVAANKPHSALVEWFFSETMDRSVERRAEAVVVPADFEKINPARGVGHYQEMCVTCHGAPGVQRGEIGQGLYPLPPDLTDSAAEMSPAEIYWIVRNGIKMTGMPAFATTHTDEQIWEITALVHRFDGMSLADYLNLVDAASRGETGSSEPHHGAWGASTTQAAP